MKTIDTAELIQRLLNGHKIIDVRAPVEFSQGALPNSVNFPILDDEERARVGTCYKHSGREKAIELGYKIVSGTNKSDKLEKWIHFIKQNPSSIMTCFRGGLRSRKSQEFLAEAGVEIPRIEKGYKEIRQFFINEIDRFAETDRMKVLTGKTGSGKTQLLKIIAEFYPVIDLEALANHRGSAFGNMKTEQPVQATFENNLAFEIIKLKNKMPIPAILLEDESRLIGRRALPEKFFQLLRSSAVVKVHVSLEQRIENIFSDYIYPEIEIFEKYKSAINKIEKRIGGARMQELLSDLENSRKQFLEAGELDSNKIWIEKLLVWYYDPMYTYSFDKRNPAIEFEGSSAEVIDYFNSIEI